MNSNLDDYDEEYFPDLLPEEEMDEVYSKLVNLLEPLNEDKNLSSFKTLGRVKRFKGLDKERDRLFSFPLSNYKFYTQFTVPKAEKQFNSESNLFQAKLNAIVRKLENGEINLADAKDLGHKVISSTYKNSFKQGGEAVASNLEFHKRFLKYIPDEQLKRADKRWIESAATEETAFFDNLLDQVSDGSISNRKYSASERVSMYAKTLKSQFEAGKVANAPHYSLIKWKMNAVLENCVGCNFLSSQKFWTKENLPTTPRAGATSCRFNCGCHLEIIPVTKEAYEKVAATALKKANADSMLKVLFK